MKEMFGVAEIIEGLQTLMNLSEAAGRGEGPGAVGDKASHHAVLVAAYLVTCAFEWNSENDTQDFGEGPVSVKEFLIRKADDSGLVSIADTDALPKTAAQLYATALYAAIKVLALALAPSKRHGGNGGEVN